MNYNYKQAVQHDASLLADIRAEAMRESLESIGRFNPDRVRSRFLEKFEPENTMVIYHDDDIIGFYAVVVKETCLYLDHLYIIPGMQNRNVGSDVISELKKQAKIIRLPLRLGALRDSRSNGFYSKHGFSKTHEEEWDIYYEWRAHY